MSEIKCKKCWGRGYLSYPYRDVADAGGAFYDRDVEYVMRTIKVECKDCGGSGKKSEAA